MLKKLHDNFKMSYTRIIALGFATIILAGALLLALPISSKSGDWTGFSSALFTAVSSTCVTGLVVFDTYTHWSIFGQLVILLMIQTGGLGFMTVITMFSIFLKRRISLHERSLLMQSAGTMRLSGVVRLIKRIIIGTAIFEGCGAVLLAIRFCPQLGFLRGLYYAVFHSVSAFCNAGFDLMGRFSPFSSLTGYRSDWLVSLTVCMLIIIGGLGFIVWDDIIAHKVDLKKYSLHSKIVLSATAVLLLGGWLLFFIFEKDASMAGFSIGDRILASLFQSTTVRTAGFNTVDLAKLSDSGSLLSDFLMLIGGSPGSTAGGVKTTTVVVLLISTVAVSRHSEHIEIFKRRLDNYAVKQATAILVIYISAVLMSALVICALEPFSIKEIAFEVISACGTVGLTCGITTKLCLASKIILMILMYGGRVGGLSLMLVLAEKTVSVSLMRPTERILIG